MYDERKYMLVDCDGVLLNWEYAFCEWMMFHGYNPVENHNQFYKIREKFGLDFDQKGDKFVRSFNESAAIGFLPPLRDAQYYVKLLAEKHSYRFICVTSLSNEPHAQELRRRNLEKMFGECFEEFIFLDTGADKDEVLAELAKQYPGALWVEDKPENADVGANLGFDSVLIEHAHNMDYQGPATVVKKWEEIYNMVTAQEIA